MPRLFLGIDLGTSGTKCVVIDARGAVVATASAPHENLFPRPGWSEERPEDWWQSACTAVRKVMRTNAARGKSKRIETHEIAAIGLSGQMHGSVFLDRKRRELTNAILWNDQRTQAECREIQDRAGGRAALIGLVRNVALTGYQAPKVLWLRKHRPGVFKRVRTVLLPKDYLRFRLTGTLGSDVSDASGTLLLDVARRRWSTELMDRLELDPALFPPVAESAQVIGELTVQAARALGLKAGIPLVAGAGDQAAAAVGTGVVRTGIVSATIGTSGVVFSHGDTPVPNDDGLLQSFCHAVPQKWCVFGCMLSAGGSLQWARRVLMADRLEKARTQRVRDAIYEAMIAEAAGASKSDSHTELSHAESSHGNSSRRKSPRAETSRGRSDDKSGPRSGGGPANDDLIFLPYLTGERCPYPHPHARGAWVGLTARHTRGDLIRAVLEGVTIGMGRQIEMMRNLGVPIREVRLAGGGARSPWWRQLQADVYGAKCLRMRSEEGSAMGAAILAAVGAGEFASVEKACEAMVKPAESYRPRANLTARYAASSQRARRIYEDIEPEMRGM